MSFQPPSHGANTARQIVTWISHLSRCWVVGSGGGGCGERRPVDLRASGCLTQLSSCHSLTFLPGCAGVRTPPSPPHLLVQAPPVPSSSLAAPFHLRGIFHRSLPSSTQHTPVPPSSGKKNAPDATHPSQTLPPSLPPTSKPLRQAQPWPRPSFPSESFQNALQLGAVTTLC